MLGKHLQNLEFLLFLDFAYELIIFAKNNITLLPTLGYYHIIQQEINKGTHLSPNTHLSHLIKAPYTCLKCYNNLPMELKICKK